MADVTPQCRKPSLYIQFQFAFASINPGVIQNDVDRQRRQLEQQSAPPKLNGPAVIGGEREKSQLLKPGGLVYVSYNAQNKGWRNLPIIADLATTDDATRIQSRKQWRTTFCRWRRKRMSVCVS